MCVAGGEERPYAAGERPNAYVGVGSNLGDSLQELRTATEALSSLGSSISTSSIYRTRPVGGPPGQDDYLNAVVVLHQPRLKPRELLAELLAIERRRGRLRTERWGPRIIDLDLLAYGEEVIDDPMMSLPHPRLHQRAFVLAPLCEVDPAWLLPDVGETACAMLERLLASGDRLEDGSDRLGAAGVERTDLRL